MESPSGTVQVPARQDSASEMHVTAVELAESEAAQFNGMVMKKLRKAMDADPETDLASKLPLNYSSRLADRKSHCSYAGGHSLKLQTNRAKAKATTRLKTRPPNASSARSSSSSISSFRKMTSVTSWWALLRQLSSSLWRNPSRTSFAVIPQIYLWQMHYTDSSDVARFFGSRNSVATRLCFPLMQRSP